VQLGPLSVTGTAPIVTPQTDTEGFSVCAVNTNQQTFTYAANDLSVNGNLFVRSFGATGTSTTPYNNFYGKVPPTTSTTSTYAFSTYALPTVSPNSTNATSNTWTNSGITWTSSSSSNLTFGPFYAFNSLLNTNECWHDDMTGYTSGTGVANTNFQTPVYTTGSSGATSTYNGQWLQIQSSVGLSMKTFYLNARGGGFNTRLPQVFYIVGSNTGTGTWTPIFKGDTASTTGSEISATVSLTDLGSSGTISNFYGSTSLIYTTYGNLVYAFNNFTYFRLIVSEICGTENTCNIAEWGLTFSSSPTTATQTGPSRALIYMDASNINQVDVSGSLGLINSNASSMIVSPNGSSATTATSTSTSAFWSNSGISWSASVSSSADATKRINNSFNTLGASAYYSSTNTAYEGWISTANYNATNGTYNNTNYTPVSSSTIYGEWIQLQSSNGPIKLINYNYIGQQYAGNGKGDSPATYTIAGSNDGNSWYNIQDVSLISFPQTTVTSNGNAPWSIITTTDTSGTTIQQTSFSVTSYAGSANAYTYFRFIIKSTIGNKFSNTNYGWGNMRGFFNFNFTPTTSSVSLALDNTTPNQLNIGGSMSVAESIAIKNTQPIKGIVTGVAATGGAGGTINFGYTFATPPYVVCNINSSSSTQIFCVNVSNITTTSFDFVRLQQPVNSSSGGGGISNTFNWIAIGI